MVNIDRDHQNWSCGNEKLVIRSFPCWLYVLAIDMGNLLLLFIIFITYYNKWKSRPIYVMKMPTI